MKGSVDGNQKTVFQFSACVDSVNAMTSSQPRVRTEDVAVDANVTFESLSLSTALQEGLNKLGFTKPSPVQVQAIPIAKLGRNVIVQSKSGTGKTLAFGIPALESLKPSFLGPQVLVLSPTRELAAQTHSILCELGQAVRGLHCNLFIGGLSYHTDVRNLSPCNVIVGTPGRIIQLINDGYLLTSSLTMFILDEADKMLEDGNMKSATLEIMKNLPSSIQFLCVSATYTEAMLQELDRRIPDPVKLLLPSGNPTLQGVKQYYVVPPDDVPIKTMTQRYEWKIAQLLKILSSLTFHQCIVFCNAATRSNSLVDKLRSKGWPTKALSAQLSQQERISAVEEFRDFKLRILLSSDLVARGLDIERINLVINLDLPLDPETYLHRVGRTGRFGSLGLAINILDPTEMTTLTQFTLKYDSHLDPLPDVIPSDLYHYELNEKDQSKKEQLEQLAPTIAQQSQQKKDQSKRSKKRKRHDVQPEPLTHAVETPSTNLLSADLQVPYHPNAFWHPSYFLQYITETYLPLLQQQIEEEAQDD